MENSNTLFIPLNSQSDPAAVAAAVEKHSIRISQNELSALENAHTRFLSAHGRVEFGKSALPTLAKAFASSPYFDEKNCTALLTELMDIFYYFRNECDGLISDEELISFMRREFDLSAAGDIGYLAGTAMERLCSRLKGKSNY